MYAAIIIAGGMGIRSGWRGKKRKQENSSGDRAGTKREDKTMHRKTKGEKLYRLRERSGMSLRQTADLVGINRSTLWRYENDEITNWNPEIVRKLCRLYHVAPDSLKEDVIPDFNFPLLIHRILSGENVRGVNICRPGRNSFGAVFQGMSERQKLRFLLTLKMMELSGQIAPAGGKRGGAVEDDKTAGGKSVGAAEEDDTVSGKSGRAGGESNSAGGRKP